MDRAEFTKGKPGKIFKAGKGSWGFYPDPLPPALSPDWDITALVSEAEHALGAVSGVTRLSSPGAFTFLFDLRESVLSGRMEGRGVSPADVLTYEQTGGTGEAPDDVAVVSNLIAATRRGADVLSDLPLSLSLAQDIHELLFKGVTGAAGVPGQFRQGGKKIMKNEGDAVAFGKYVPPSEDRMKIALFAFDKFMRQPSAIPPLVRAALVFYQFNVIRPFPDGNNMTSRALLDLAIRRAASGEPFPSIGMSAWLERNSADYEEAFLDVVRAGAWIKWMEFILRGVKEQAEDTAGRVIRLMRLREKYHADIMEGRSSALLPQLADELFAGPAVTTAGASESLRVTFRAAQLNIDKLVEMGVLEEATGRKRNRVYVAVEIIKAVME